MMDHSVKKKIFGVLIVLSVLLNVFFIGISISVFNRLGFPPMPPSPINEMHRAAKSLPEASRIKVEAVIDAHHEDLQKYFGDMRGSFDALLKIMTADKFDSNAFQSARASMQTRDESMNNEMNTIVMDIVNALPDADRIKFFNNLTPPHPPFMTPTEK